MRVIVVRSHESPINRLTVKGIGRLWMMEYMEGSLKNLIDSRKKKSWRAWTTSESATMMLPLKFDEVVCIIFKLAQGMAYLHSIGVSHRGLTARNVIHVPRACRQLWCQNCGFRCMTIRCRWRAPELFDRGAEYGIIDLKAGDVYSFAMTCYEIVTGNKPFQGMQIKLTNIKAWERPKLPRYLIKGINWIVFGQGFQRRASFWTHLYLSGNYYQQVIWERLRLECFQTLP